MTEEKTPEAGLTAESVSELQTILASATPEAKAALRDALGVSATTPIKKKRRRNSNAEARMLVHSIGEVYHKDPDWKPIPSQAIVEKGDAAIAAWFEKWENGQQLSERELHEIEELASSAQM